MSIRVLRKFGVLMTVGGGFGGVEKRRVFDPERRHVLMEKAEQACKEAIRAAGCSHDDIDLIIANCSSPYIPEADGAHSKYRFAPRLGGFLKKKIGLANAVFMDTEEECMSFVVALQLAASFVKSGRYRKVLLCSAEQVTKILDGVEEPTPVFGDGVSAMVVGRSDSQREWDLVESHYLSDSEHLELATARWRNQDEKLSQGDFGIYFTLRQNPEASIQAVAPQSVPKIVQLTLDKAGLQEKDIGYFLFHQPARMLVETWAHRLGFLEGRYGSVVKDYGCLSSVSIPLVMHKAIQEKKLTAGSLVVIATPGVGWSFGAQIWRLGEIKLGVE